METKLLSIQDMTDVIKLDDMSGFYVEQWLEYNEDYAWGFFKDNILVGYCTTGYADCIDNCPSDSILLSDVFIRPEYRHNHYGTQMIKGVINNRWQSDGVRNAVFLTMLYDSLAPFYEQIGFKKVNDNGLMML